MNTFFFDTRGFTSTPGTEIQWDSVLSLISVLSQQTCFPVVDICVKRGAELSADHHLVVCILRGLELSKNKEMIQTTKSIQNKVGVTSPQKGETHFLQAKLLPRSENSLTILKMLRLGGIYLNQQSLYQQLLIVVANVWEVKWAVSKELLGGTNKLKKLLVQRKLRLELGYQTSHLSSFDCVTPQHRRLPPLLSNNVKKSYGKNLNNSWIQTTDRQTKYFGKPSIVCVANKHQLPSLLRILMVCF